MTTQTDDTADEPTREINFEVYRDSTHTDPGFPEYFAVMTCPGPDIPSGTLHEIQEAVDERVFELEDGESLDPAGTVTYKPGRLEGEVLDIDFEE